MFDSKVEVCFTAAPEDAVGGLEALVRLLDAVIVAVVPPLLLVALILILAFIN